MSILQKVSCFHSTVEHNPNKDPVITLHIEAQIQVDQYMFPLTLYTRSFHNNIILLGRPRKSASLQ